MSTSDHNRWSDELAAYALGALESGEATAFERHLEGCERCRAELRWLEPAVQSLPEAVERRQPPPGLRASLMAEVRADTRPAEKPRYRWNWRPAMAFAAIVLIAAAVAGYEVGKGGGGDEGASTVVAHEHGITVKMVREGSGGELQLANVRQLPPKKVLEAWVRREGKVEPVPALFVPDREGRAETTIADMSGVDTVMVTAEPRGGSVQPTGAPIVSVAIPQ
jgi:anti-sigma-K factor RskA